MKKNFIKNFVFFIILPSFLIIFSSCATNSNAGSQARVSGTKIQAAAQTLEQDQFYIINRDSFTERKLSNGIPVIIKKSFNQKNCVVRLVFDRTPTFSGLKNSGVEQVTLELLKAGTKTYSPLYISSLEYTDATKFSGRVHCDYLEFEMNTVREKAPDMASLLAQMLKAPLLNEEDFKEILAFKKAELQKSDEGKNLLEKIYRDLNSIDSYYDIPFMTEESQIKYSDVVSCHRELVNASRIKILASGNFTDEDIAALIDSLNKNFSDIKSAKFSKKNTALKKFPMDELKKLRAASDEENRNAAIGVFTIPDIADDQYLSYGLMSLYLDDMLYSQLKEKYSCAGDAGSGIVRAKPAFGTICIYDISQKKDVKPLVKDYIVQNMQTEQINKKLEQYKRIYTSVIQSCEFSASKSVEQMTLSLVYSGDAKSYISKPFKISKLTAEDVKAAFDSTVAEGICWY